jgi:integrase
MAKAASPEPETMASFDYDPVSGRHHIRFRYGKTPFKRALRLEDDREAERVCAQIEETLKDLKRGRLVMPADAEPGAFILSGGKLTGKPTPPPKQLTVDDLLELYRENFPVAAKAKTTLLTEAIHRKHLVRVLGQKTLVNTLTSSHIQKYVNQRAEEVYRGRTTSPDTILKELGTLRVIWNWGIRQGHLTAPVPFMDRQLDFARTEEKPPFRTFEEIKQVVEWGGLKDDEVAALWECLYLRLEQVHEVLELVKERATAPWIYPMFVLVAMTGMRRSEMVVSRREHFNFNNEVVSVREKKRVKGVTSYRTIDINPFLGTVMKEWFAVHPGGPYTICQRNNEPLTVDQATDHFNRTLAGTKWEVIGGFHTLRHSFASNLAAAGVDEPTIDAWMGHQTDEQRKRYRHLFPQNRKRSIGLLSPDKERRGES